MNGVKNHNLYATLPMHASMILQRLTTHELLFYTKSCTVHCIHGVKYNSKYLNTNTNTSFFEVFQIQIQILWKYLNTNTITLITARQWTKLLRKKSIII
jgi:hypothetical protein